MRGRDEPHRGEAACSGLPHGRRRDRSLRVASTQATYALWNTPRPDKFAIIRSEDLVAAMRLVVADEVKLLWLAAIEPEGSLTFVRRGAPQFTRWEARSPTPSGFLLRGEPVA